MSKLPQMSKPVLAVAVFLTFLCIGELNDLPYLMWFSLISGVISVIALIISLFKYAIQYQFKQ